MKAFKIAIGIILWIAFIILAVVAVRFFILGGWDQFKAVIEEKGFLEFIKWFFESMWSGGNYTYIPPLG